MHAAHQLFLVFSAEGSRDGRLIAMWIYNLFYVF